MTIDVEIAPPFYADVNGVPLQGGLVYFGQSGQNPQTSPITVYWDAASTQPAAQPVAVSNGVTMLNGSPARVYVPSAYSRLVVDSNGMVVRYDATIQAPVRSDLSQSSGSSLIGFLQSGTGAVARTLQDKGRDAFSVKDYGAKGDGATDDTAAITVADAAARVAGRALKFPAGTYLAGSLALGVGSCWIGEGVTQTKLKLKAGSNSAFITSPNNSTNDVTLAHMTIDGNSGNNTGNLDTLTVTGSRPTLYDLAVINAAGNGILTNWNSAADGARVTGCEGYFAHVTVDSAQKSGWIHNGPSDSHFESVIIIDAGLLTNNTYYGLYLGATTGNGRFFNCHVWNRDTTTNVPTHAVSVVSSGNNFAGCHFEGGTTPLNITGSANTFAACSAYAPRGQYCINMAGSSNTFQGNIGLTYATANPNYRGVLLQGPNNILDIANSGSGCTQGAVDFSSDPGQNNVRLVGNQATGTVYLGTPAVSTEVFIAVGGAAGLVYSQQMEVPWTAFGSTGVTSGSGTLTSATAATRYRKQGKTVFYESSVTITTNGTGASNIQINLPYAAKQVQAGCGRANVISGKQLQCLANGTVLTIWNYDGTYPGASGETLVVSGAYEAA